MLIFNISTVSTQLFLKSRESRKVAQKTYLEKKKFGLRRSFHLEVNLPYLTPQWPRAISRTYTAYTPLRVHWVHEHPAIAGSPR